MKKKEEEKIIKYMHIIAIGDVGLFDLVSGKAKSTFLKSYVSISVW